MSKYLDETVRDLIREKLEIDHLQVAVLAFRRSIVIVSVAAVEEDEGSSTAAALPPALGADRGGLGEEKDDDGDESDSGDFIFLVSDFQFLGY